MPRSVVRTSANEVEVTVRGATFVEMRDKAVHEAAAYFDVDPSQSELKVMHSLGKPHITDADGRVVQYKATMTIRMADPDDEHEDRPAGPDVDDDDD